jgi:hypothetical protein
MSTKHCVVAALVGAAVGFYFSVYIAKWTGVNPMIPKTTATAS